MRSDKGGKTMKGFECDKEYLILTTKANRNPMESSCGVVNILENIYCCFG